MTTKLSTRGLFAIAVHEGIVPAYYVDVVGMPTWGIGHTHMAGPPDPRQMARGLPAASELDATLERVWKVFMKDMERYTKHVVDTLGPNLAQHELDGWVGFHFNTGGVFRTSAVPKWKAGDKAGAMAVLRQWNKGTINGQKRVLSALVDRRRDETDLIMTGNYGLAGKVLPVWRVSSSHRPIYSQPLRTYSYDQWQEFLRSRGLLTKVGGVSTGVGAVVGGGVVAAVSFWDRIEAWITNLFGGLF
jgi:lysozyme